MRAAAAAAGLGAIALLCGCSNEPPPGLEDPRELHATVRNEPARQLGSLYPLSVDFVSARQGFLTTQGDRLLITEDGGATWRPTRARINFLGAIDFVSRRRGYALTLRSVLLATRDGGDSWQRVHRFPYDKNSRSGSIVFVDAKHGWAAPFEGRTYRTADAGQTWERIKLPCRDPHFATGPAFVDERRGYLVCGSVPATDMQEKVVYSTVDGGLTWQRVQGSPPGMGFAHRLRFRSARTGFLLSSRQGLDRTDDGGKTWHTALFTDDEDDVADVSSPTPRRVFAALFHAGLMRSDDAGRHWRRVYPRGAATPHGPTLFFTPSRGIAFGAEHVLGGANAVFVTKDGGGTWFARGEVPLRLVEQAFRFGPKVLAASSKTLVRSNDEGRTWQHVFSIPGKHYGSFGFLSSSVGFYVDESHRIYRTDDGGSTWSLETRADRELREALFLSEKEALVQDVPPPTPDNGKKPFLWTPLKTLRSTDSGRHWRPIKGPFGSLFGGYRLDHDHWWILAEPLCRFPAPGCDRQLWRTTDGGRHWDLILGSAVDPPLTFVSPKMGFAGSPASGLYRTTDGGLTWQGVVRPQ